MPSQKMSRSQEIDTRFSRDCKNSNLEEKANHDRTGRPVVCSQSVGSSSTFKRGGHRLQNIWIATFIVKQSENSRVRELVKKIENHPHRQDLQADLQQNNAYKPFSEKSKKNVHWTFSRFKIMSLRREDIMAIDMGRLKNKETTMLPII